MAQEITGLLVMHDREAVLDTVAESHEIDFDIPVSYAISIYGLRCWLKTGAFIAGLNEMGVIVDIDGAALASNSINTQALYEAREVLASCIANWEISVDIITTGAGMISDQETLWFPQPIITARNPGIAYLSLGTSGEAHIGIYYKWVRISDMEFAQLVSSRRA